MKKSTKLISLLLAVMMVVALLPAAALADEADSSEASAASSLTDVIGEVVDLINGVKIPDYLVYCSLASKLPASGAVVTMTNNLTGETSTYTANMLGLALISKEIVGVYSVAATCDGALTGIKYSTIAAVTWSSNALHPDVDKLVLYPVLNIGLNYTDHFAYLIGCGDGTVQPNSNITRAEVATILFRLLTDESRDKYMTKTNSFSDVNEGSWYNNAISTLANAKIVNGVGGGLFEPTRAVTRAEFSAMIARLFSVEYTGSTLFEDLNGHWASNYMNLLKLLGILKGDGNGNANPDDNLTRAEAAAMVNRLVGRMASASSTSGCTGTIITFPDNADTGVWYYADILEATNSHDYTWTVNARNIISGNNVITEQWTSIRTDCPNWSALQN